MCDALGVATFANPRFEADDIIGSLTALARGAGENVVLVTRDKDLAQLVRPGDHYWDYIADERFAYHQIAERFGVLPERMACFLALMGDAVDNIPGVPGIGRKTASLLFKHFESLQQLYDEMDRVRQLKLRNAGFVCEQLREYRERAFLARRLTEIACNMPLDVGFDGLKRRKPNLDALRALYDAVNFGPLLRHQAGRILDRAA
jgi:5'-3' exonuclease